MTDNKCYVVKSIRLMMYLVRKGFNVVNVIDDINNPKYKVFCFYEFNNYRCWSEFSAS